MSFDFSQIKGVQVKLAVPPDAIPQERVTGDILKGRGPRRGNLERLLRYWRPIMRREGGFRRCRVILADHPELFPLNNICAWLHHETTGLWPNEGCHHPGMKNCRKKIQGIVDGSIINDNEFAQRLSRLRGNDGKALDFENDSQDIVTESDFEHAKSVLNDFIEMENKFIIFINDDNNWLHEGQDEDGNWSSHDWMKPEGHEKNCGCG
jgi:hypothetical protein